MGGDNFYFLAYACENRSSVTVVDLAESVSYERNDWPAVNEINFQDRDEAIQYAKELCEKYRLSYINFKSRYDSSLNETESIRLP